MNELFGFPAATFAAVLAAGLGLVVAIVATLAVRNRIFFKLGVRNVGRRRARTSLIVAGLMLGTTIIAAALASGDTVSNTIRSQAIESLGATDVLVSTEGAEITPGVPLSENAGIEYFHEDVVPLITHELVRDPATKFDGVAPAIIEPVAVQDVTSRQNEPRVTLFASSGPYLAAFGPIRTQRGPVLSLDDLRPGEVFLNADAAEELRASAGDRVRVFAGERSLVAKVRAVVTFQGTGTDGAALLTTLPAAQELLGRPHGVKHVLVSGLGGTTDGARHTEEILRVLQPLLGRMSLEADPVKNDALEAADEWGNSFMSLFTTFGIFSIVAGLLLIFLIFVMLAAERRGELGIARAVGTRRAHLVQMYLHEGMAYDLLAAAVGAAIGIGVAFAMVAVMASAFAEEGLDFRYGIEPRSIVIAYAIGVLLTFAVVTVSAWRVSRMNIATAVRNLPEPPSRRRRRGWILGTIAIAAGAVLVASAIASAQASTLFLGVALLLAGGVPVASAIGVRPRLSYTAAGIALVTFCLLPFGWLNTITQTELEMNFSVWTIAGLLLVLGASWVIVFNADVLLGVVTATVGRFRALTPVLRLAMAYPLRNRFRTGVTLAMFTLVVFTLVVGTVTSGSFIRAFDDSAKFGGGFDIHATSATVSPIRDPQVALAAAGLDTSLYRVAASQANLALEATQAGTGRKFETYSVSGVDERFLRNTTYTFSAKARGYPDPWRALEEQPGLAVVDGFVVPRRANWNAGTVPPDFKLTGFYIEDEVFDPIPVRVRDPQTGRVTKLTVIGVLSDFTPELLWGITTSQPTLERAFGDRAIPTAYWYDLADGVDSRAEAARLESAFLQNGVEAQAIDEMVEDAVSASWTFNRLLMGFMGLGLVVGVAALGVISARAVVERRQQIGILRAIGFRKGMIQLSFLLESSFVAVTAILVGTALGLTIGNNVVRDLASTPGYAGVTLAVPWATLAVIFVVVYVVALATTLAPAVRASRIYPAQALRYE